jgi:hypothetical protein
MIRLKVGKGVWRRYRLESEGKKVATLNPRNKRTIPEFERKNI